MKMEKKVVAARGADGPDDEVDDDDDDDECEVDEVEEEDSENEEIPMLAAFKPAKRFEDCRVCRQLEEEGDT